MSTMYMEGLRRPETEKFERQEMLTQEQVLYSGDRFKVCYHREYTQNYIVK